MSHEQDTAPVTTNLDNKRKKHESFNHPSKNIDKISSLLETFDDEHKLDQNKTGPSKDKKLSSKTTKKEKRKEEHSNKDDDSENGNDDKNKVDVVCDEMEAEVDRTADCDSLAAATPNTNGLGTGGPDSSPNKQQDQQKKASNACCFCWCCCCSCSCLTVKNNEENSSRSKESNRLDVLNGDHEPLPSLEDIRDWGESFEKLMKCSAGREIFRDFLRGEYSEENIMFWLACEDLKNETNPELIEEKARLIYEDYISILSPKEVSLDARVRDIINRNMVEPMPHTFDEAQLQIYTLMHRDSYPRFINSAVYRKLAQLPVPSRKGSTA